MNESQVLPDFLAELLKQPYEVVAVDDGSTDNSVEILRKSPVHLLTHATNRGQGAALRTGIAYALNKGAEFIVTMDSDGQMNPKDIPSLMAPVMDGSCDLTLGNRFGHADLQSSGLPFLRKYALWLGAWMLWALCGLKLHDSQNGFRVLSKYAAEKIEIRQDRMAHNWEILFQAAKQKLRVQEVPVHISYSEYSLKKGQKLKGVLQILWDLLTK